MTGALIGKVGAGFTSTATQHGGQETTIFSILTNLLHFGMMSVGVDYGFQGQMGVGEVHGNSPYGASTIAYGNGSRLASGNDLEGARYLCRLEKSEKCVLILANDVRAEAGFGKLVHTVLGDTGVPHVGSTATEQASRDFSQQNRLVRPSSGHSGRSRYFPALDAR